MNHSPYNKSGPCQTGGILHVAPKFHGSTLPLIPLRTLCPPYIFPSFTSREVNLSRGCREHTVCFQIPGTIKYTNRLDQKQSHLNFTLDYTLVNTFNFFPIA